MMNSDVWKINSRVALQDLSENARCGVDFGILLFHQNKLLTCCLREHQDLMKKKSRCGSIPGWDNDIAEKLRLCQSQGKDFYATLTDWGVAIHGVIGGTLPDFSLSVVLYTSDRGVARVLHYAFGDRVKCSPEVLALVGENMRREDEKCYSMIGQLLSGWKSMLYGCGVPQESATGKLCDSICCIGQKASALLSAMNTYRWICCFP